MSKLISPENIKALFYDGMRLMMGGFACHGAPKTLIDLVVESGVKDITVISNDTGDPDVASGRLVRSGQAKKFISSHVGMNPETSAAIAEGRMEVELCPQGSFAERVRSGGTGLGGILVKTGLGTVIEEGKQKVAVNGETWLLETPLRANIAFVKARKSDTVGNLAYRGTSRNFNPLVAMAADIVIVEADEIVPVGELAPDDIVTPSVFITYILEGGAKDEYREL
jgi:acetate CoA/acetoacetate CoA-transferase alpha subunit